MNKEIKKSIIKMYEPLKEQDLVYYENFQKILDYIEELQERIDKAIEHIETHQLCYQSQYEEMSGFDNHLLDILRGEDDNIRL